MTTYLPHVEILPEGETNAAIIWLHGLGASGHDFEGIVPELSLSEQLKIHFVFPHAPELPITVNNNYVMPAWFDITDLGKERAINFQQLSDSVIEVHKLIDREIENGIDSKKILLAGFSQGGAVCYQAALTYNKPLAGLMALSTWFPTAETIDVHPSNASLPIEIYHGTEDPVLAPWMAENSVKALKELDLSPQLYTYQMAHTVSFEEIRQMSIFLNSALIS